MIVNRICPSCELEAFKQNPQLLIKYNWKQKKYNEGELFSTSVETLECELHQKTRAD